MIDAGVCEHGLPSTVIDMTVYPPKVMREGAGNHHFIDSIIMVYNRIYELYYGL